MLRCHRVVSFCVAMSAFALSQSSFGDAKLAATQFVFKSTGSIRSTDYNLFGNGYIGTFIKLNAAAVVTLKIQALGQPADEVWPQMGLHVGNRQFSFTVANPYIATYTATATLPAGTSLVRIEFLNDYVDPITKQDRNLILRDLSVSAVASSGLQIVNPVDMAALKDTVFAAADTTVENYRKQSGTVTLIDASGKPWPKGTSVRFHLTRHNFNFGTAVAGIQMGDPMSPNPSPGSDAAKYQTAIVQNFNLIEEENAGKWQYNEGTRNKVTMDYVDQILKFAQLNGLRVRHHNLLWGQQQPDWAINLENTALGADAKKAAAAKVDLTKAISFRNGYVVHDRSTKYQELDGINEASPGHQPVFLNIYGYPGIATIYNNAVIQARGVGSSAHVYFNDYNILNNSPDNYANWYLDFIDSVLSAGITPGNRGRLGVGVQYYTGSGSHNAVQIYQSLANLATLALPISLTEFGIGAGDSGAAQILAETVRLVFGTDQATTFNNWGFFAPWMWQSGCAFFDAQWNITPAGKVWQQMTGVKNWGLAGVPFWSTDLTVTTDANGKIYFRGFAGNYSVTIGKSVAAMPLVYGTAVYKVTVPR